jgi:hypothetical protein
MFCSRITLWFAIGCTFVAMQSCGGLTKAKQEIMVIESVEQAKQAIEQYHGKAADFVLPIPQDRELTLHGEVVSRDVAIAVITDQILARGWMPNGFDAKGQIRYYKYSQ